MVAMIMTANVKRRNGKSKAETNLGDVTLTLTFY
jgi:hypothetical protein